MRYESLLASRYIKSQKRQSIFTLISIAVAVAVMTMLFVLYGTFTDNARTNAYNQAPYHVIIFDWPENKASVLRNDTYVDSVRFERHDTGTLTASIMLKNDISDPSSWVDSLIAKIQNDRISYDWNRDLMFYDGIGSDAIVKKFLYFGIFLVFVLLFALALRLVVDTAFEVSAKERVRHYGVLQSIGATPKQIVGIITREGLRLCVIAVPIGLALGLLFAFGMYRAVMDGGLSELLNQVEYAELELRFSVRPLMLLVAAVVGVIWTFFSAYGVGMRVVKQTPIDAITARPARVQAAKKAKRSGKLSRKLSLLGPLSGLLFGLPGRIAYRNARRQKKRFRITVLTLTVSITLFAIFTAIVDNAENFLKQIFFEQYDGYLSFDVSLRGDSDSGKTVSDTLDLVYASDLFDQVHLYAYESFQTEYRHDDPSFQGEYEYRGIAAHFVDQAEYQSLFGENPPISYAELTKLGGFVYIPAQSSSDYEIPQEEAAWMADFRLDAESGTISVCSHYQKEPTEQELQNPNYVWSEPELRPHEITVCAVAEPASWHSLVGTMDTYIAIKDDWFGTTYIDAQLKAHMTGKDDQATYQKILSFFRAHSNLIVHDWDNYAEYMIVLNALAAIRAGILFLNCIIALAALINLLNIVCTGIANRRSELASLQCVGMTDGQLLRMTLAECLQYVMKAALITAVICGLIIVGFKQLLLPGIMELSFGADWILYADTEEGKILMNLVKLDSAVIFVRIALASAAAFAAGCAASVAMLRAQGKQSLAERIRNAE